MEDGNEDRDRDKKRKKGWRNSSLIDHTYYDYSTELLPSESMGNSADEQKGRVTFPMKLHGIVSNPAYRHIICWMPHGRSWKILNKELLASVVCKQNFNHDNFDSFNRSVNGWGFKRLMRAGPDHKSYYHEMFLRGRPELARLMTRLINPGKRIPDPKGEPDFYRISKDFPLPVDPHDVANDTRVDDISERPFQHHAAMVHDHLNNANYDPAAPPYAPSPLLDPSLSKRQRRERFSFPPDNSNAYPGVFRHGYGYVHYPPAYAPYPPYPYSCPTGPYGELYGHHHSHSHSHSHNPYISPERHYSAPYNYNQYYDLHSYAANNSGVENTTKTGYEHHAREYSLGREATANAIHEDNGQRRHLKHDNNQRQNHRSTYFRPPVIHHGSPTAESTASSHAPSNSYSHCEDRSPHYGVFPSFDNPSETCNTHIRYNAPVDGVTSANVLTNGNSRAGHYGWSEYPREMGEQKRPADRIDASEIRATAIAACPSKEHNPRLEWSGSFSTDVCTYVLGDDHGPSNGDEQEYADRSEP